LIYPEDIFTHNASQISFDLALLKCEKIDSLRFGGNTLIGEDIFIHESVSLYGVVLDSSKGPIYIGEKTIVEPGVVINGPVAIGANCRLKTGALLYPNVTLGDLSTICGELNNVVIWGNSTKGHYGYLGCAVVG
jgi:UDP-3-O-[3-hydroxymyristoyl] glucosamine N-acyltransferase